MLRPEQRYEVSHVLVHTYARQVADPKRLAILGVYYQYLAERESKKGVAGYQALEDSRAHMLDVLEQSGEIGQWNVVNQLVEPLHSYLEIQGYGMDIIKVCNLGILASQVLENRFNEGTWLGGLGKAYRDLGQINKAILFFKQALKIAISIDDKQNEGGWLVNLGNAYHAIGKAEKAIEFHEQALVISQSIGNRQIEGTVLGSLGIVYNNLGEVEKAIEYHEKALEIAQEIGDHRGESAHFGNLVQTRKRYSGKWYSRWQEKTDLCTRVDGKRTPMVDSRIAIV